MSIYIRGGRGRLAILRSMTGCTASLFVAACGGGGGGVNSAGTTPPPIGAPAPTPAPTPTPTPAPTPAPSSADSAEYKASAAVVSAKAAYAYDRGITGKGVVIAILDSGINTTTAELAGRISADSTGFEQKIARCGTCAPEIVPPFSIVDLEGHGTEVASVASAARNGAGVQGMAPDATILALKVVAPSFEGVTAGSTTPILESPDVNSALIGPAIGYSVAKGAFVTVLSINGAATGQIATDLRAGMNAVRAADRLMIESVSNATGEDSFAGQIAESLVGTDRANKDWFLFAIGVNADGSPRGPNGNPGSLADRMIAAVGVNVRVVQKDGSYGVVTGNSFAAPAVGGAAALLKQYWPQLGGSAIARILLDTATDLGAPGVDQIYGAGLLNVEKAMQAQAPASSFVSAQAVLARFSGITVSAPFGGAATAAALGARVGSMMVVDRYGRDFSMKGMSGIRSRTSGLLANAMTGMVDPVMGRPASALDARLGFNNPAPIGPWQGTLTGRPAVAAFSPSSGQMITLGANVGVGGAGGSSMAGSYLRGAVGQPIGMSSSWVVNGWSAAFSSGESNDPSRSPSRRAALRTAAFGTPSGLGFEVTELTERGGVLGFGDATAMDSRGAKTMLATASVQQTLGGVRIVARATAGSTQPQDSGAFRFDGRIISTAFAVEGTRSVWGGAATIGLSSPLRVERARASVLLPLSYDLISGALVEERRKFNLSPSARELDLELGWTTTLAQASTLRVGVARAFDAGHVRGATDTAAFIAVVLR